MAVSVLRMTPIYLGQISTHHPCPAKLRNTSPQCNCDGFTGICDGPTGISRMGHGGRDRRRRCVNPNLGTHTGNISTDLASGPPMHSATKDTLEHSPGGPFHGPVKWSCECDTGETRVGRNLMSRVLVASARAGRLISTHRLSATSWSEGLPHTIEASRALEFIGPMLELHAIPRVHDALLISGCDVTLGSWRVY